MDFRSRFSVAAAQTRDDNSHRSAAFDIRRNALVKEQGIAGKIVPGIDTDHGIKGVAGKNTQSRQGADIKIDRGDFIVHARCRKTPGVIVGANPQIRRDHLHAEFRRQIHRR